METIEMQYTVKIIAGRYAGRLIYRILSKDEVKNGGIEQWITDHNYFRSIDGPLSNYIQVVEREMI